MTCENSASYARIGFTVSLGVVAIIGTLIWLGGLRGRQNRVIVETYCCADVGGLSVGSTVNFRGVKVGEVSEIGFVGDYYVVEGVENHRVCLRMSFPQTFFQSYADDGYTPERLVDEMVRHGLRATVAASGITGLSHIELDMKPEVAPPKISWTPKVLYVPSAPSLMNNFSVAATKVMNQINRMDIDSVWSNLNSTAQSLSGASESARTMLETRQADIDQLLGDVLELSASLKQLVNELKENPSLLIRERMPSALPETER